MAESVLSDVLEPRPVEGSRVVFEGAVWSVRQDAVDLGAGGVVVRDYIDHPGAVAVLALDADDRVLLVRQYRHPVRSMCWELPAGLRDVTGEAPLLTARRELVEETAHTASTWFELLDFRTSPGGSSEQLTVFLARDLTPVPEADRHDPEGEEIGMAVEWFGFDDVLEAVLAGRLANPSLVAGVLAAAAHRAAGWGALRPV